MSETIKIFVSYPGGLEKEVKHLRRCVDQMNKRRSNTPPIAIITWDKNIPAKSTGVLPQGYLSQHIDSCSGYICLIHNTVGKANNGDSDTLAEYAHALNLSKKRNDGFFISVFFKNFAIKTDASDEEVTAYEQVRDFQKKARSHSLSDNNLGKDSLRRLTRLRLLIRPIDNRPLRQSTIDLVGLDENRLELTHQKKKLKHKK